MISKSRRLVKKSRQRRTNKTNKTNKTASGVHAANASRHGAERSLWWIGGLPCRRASSWRTRGSATSSGVCKRRRGGGCTWRCHDCAAFPERRHPDLERSPRQAHQRRHPVHPSRGRSMVGLSAQRRTPRLFSSTIVNRIQKQSCASCVPDEA